MMLNSINKNMAAFLYKLACLSNMHIRSASSNYGIVDSEVKKDSLIGCPMIRASRVKGTLKANAERVLSEDVANQDRLNSILEKVFGSPTKRAEFAFVDAHMLTRPLRASGGNGTSINATTPCIVNNFITLAKSFKCMPEGIAENIKLLEPNFVDSIFLCSVNDVRVENEEKTALLDTFTAQTFGIEPEQLKFLKKVLGNDFALVKSFENYPLSVSTMTNLRENQKLYCDEFVPHHTVFYLIIVPPKDYNADIDVNRWLKNGSIVQFGKYASVGFGYTLIEKWNY